MSGEPEELGLAWSPVAGDWISTGAYVPPLLPEPLHQVFVQVLSDKDATVAQVTSYTTDGRTTTRVTTTGSSKRERGDSHKREIGDTLALGRALSKLGHRLEKQAQSKINEAANIKAHHEAIAVRKAAEERLRADAKQGVQLAVGGLIDSPHSEDFSFTWDSSGGRGLVDWTPPNPVAPTPLDVTEKPDTRSLPNVEYFRHVLQPGVDVVEMGKAYGLNYRDLDLEPPGEDEYPEDDA